MLRPTFGMNGADDVKMISPSAIGSAVPSVRATKIHAAQLFTSQPPKFPRGSYEFADAGARRRYFLPLSPLSPAASVDNAATNASCGTSTRPMVFIRFLPSFCFSRSLRLRVMSPP
jgi:hypothetical protein